MGTSLKILFLSKKDRGILCSVSLCLFLVATWHSSILHCFCCSKKELLVFRMIIVLTISGTYFRTCGGNDPCLWLLRWLHFVGPSPKGVCDDVEEVRNKRATRQSETWSLKTVIVNTPKQLLPQNFKWRNRTMTKKLQQNKKKQNQQKYAKILSSLLAISIFSE